MTATGARGRGTLLVVLALLVAAFAVYGRTATHEFVHYDDDEYIFENPSVYGGLSAASVSWALTTYHASNWHPLTWLSHMLDCRLFGLDAGPHHLVSAGLHAAGSILLFLAFRRMTGDLWPSAFVAALFAVHPLRVESVAWAAERKDVLSGLFFMLTLVAYAAYARRPGLARYAWVAIALALGLLAKPMLVTLPLVLLLLDVWPLGRFRPGSGGSVSPWRLVVEKLPLFALVAGSSAVTLLAQGRGGNVQALEVIPLGARLANSLLSYVAYLWKMIWPTGLAVLYPHPALVGADGFGSFHGPAIAAGLLLVAVTVFALRQAGRRPYLAVGWLWYLATLLPVIGLVQVGDQARADRYAYVPLIGVSLMLAWGLAEAASHRPPLRRVLGFAGPLAIGALAVVAWAQVGHWRNTTTLFERALAVTTSNYVAHNNLAGALHGADDLEGAAEHYLAALRIRPGYARAHHNLGVVYRGLGRLNQAEQQYRETLTIDPDHVAAHVDLGAVLRMNGKLDEAEAALEQAIRLEPNSARAHYNLGVTLRRRGELDRAARELEQALALDPAYAEAHYNLGVLHARRGDATGAEREFDSALALKPTMGEAHYGLGLLRLGGGEPDEAMAQFERALEVTPDHAESSYQLGLLFARRGDAARAAALFERAIASRPDYVQAHYNLGVVHARNGDMLSAAERFEIALRIHPGHGGARRSLVAAAQSLVESYTEAGDMREAARWEARLRRHSPAGP